MNIRAVAVVTVALLGATVAQAQDSVPAISVDSVLVVVRRAQRLVNEGNGAEGRALLDTLLERTEPKSAAEAEGLYWRATLAESWEVAQRDYLRLMLEHERAPRAADAMLRLAQGEVARGDRDAALRFLERLAREAPESGARAEAGLWHGRLLIERGSRAEGCAMLRSTRGRVRAGALELENQYDYLLRGCPSESTPAPVTSAPAPAPSAPTPTTPVPSAPTPAPTSPAPSPSTATVWSVQVGAFGTKVEADEFAAEVGTMGYPTRVDGTTAPFRVRFGRYATREEAQRAMQDYKTRARADAFLTQVPRG